MEVIDCFKVGEQDIIVLLKCEGATGIQEGIKLQSSDTGMQWIVQARLLFAHTADIHKRFQGETERIGHLSFGSVENQEKSRANILDNEKQGIYQYIVHPHKHEDKLTKGDKLEVYKEEKNSNFLHSLFKGFFGKAPIV